jgi:hypothetical protein
MKEITCTQFLIKIFFFLLPLFLLIVIDLSLPVNYFSHRFWEATSVYNKLGRILLPGPFYPNMDMAMNETGDLGVHSPYEVIKKVEWITNKDGYRTRLSPDKHYDIVVIGDSLAAGSSLSQKEIVAEALSKNLNQDVYNMGGLRMTEFLNTDYIETHKPKVVVLIQMERTLTDVSSFSVSRKQDVVSRLHTKVQKYVTYFHAEKLIPVFVIADRFLKLNMYHYLRANAEYLLDPKSVIKYDGSPMLFFQGEVANKEVPKDEFDLTVSKIAEVNKYLQSQGIQFVFVPIPNKETMYWDVFPKHVQPHFIPDLVQALRKNNVTAINVQDAFLKAMQKDKKVLYHTDDTHWNKEGVNETVKAIISIPNFNK